jgi:Fic family protein
MPQENVVPEKRDDWSEVQQYIEAMNYAIANLGDLPLSIRLIKDTHRVLMSGVRGEKKTPGELRTSQNWIGGSNIRDAFFIPPHPDEVPALLGDLEKFWHNHSLAIPRLIRIAISHYQFETIHPFLDGNGRIGRLLITLHLIEQNFLKKPSLYLSDFFEKNKGAYYDSLTMVRESNDIGQWVKFFMNGVIETSKKGKSVLEAILSLDQSYERKIITLGKRAKLARELLLKLYSNPVTSVSSIGAQLSIGGTTASRLANTLVALDILKEITRFRRNRIFILWEYLNQFKG